MAEGGEIVNRVEASGLVQLNLSEWLPDPTVRAFDLAPYLWQGLVLQEKPFRQAIAELQPEAWTDATVALHCSADAIIPDWAWMLVTARFAEAGVAVRMGDVDTVRELCLIEALDSMDFTAFDAARVVVKGCSSKGGPALLSGLVQKLQPRVKSLMFGEACSTVPIFKRRQ